MTRPRAIVVGGGVIGTWHAVELCAHGFEVHQLDADAEPTGASIRNFGLIWVSGRRNGEELDVAQRARHRWEELAANEPDLGFRPNGSITVATTDAERAVMQAFAAHPDASERGITFLDSAEAVAARNPAITGQVVNGGLHCTLDATVEPRRALKALRHHLTTQHAETYTFHPRTRVATLAPHAAVDRAGRRWEGDVVIVATGAAFDHLPGPAVDAAADRLQRVRLQMFETEPRPTNVPPLTTSIADADSLRYYPAYHAVDLSPLGPQTPVAAEHHLQLLLVQRADGGLTIGDTHAYEEPFDFDLADAPTDELLQRVERILGVPPPPIARRWEGVYAQCRDGAVCLRQELEPSVVLVTGPGGRGMTCSPAIAADTLSHLGITSPVPAPTLVTATTTTAPTR